MKNLLLVLALTSVVFALEEEEKPCGHAYEEKVQWATLAPTSEQDKIDMKYYGLDFFLNVLNSTMQTEFDILLAVVDTSLDEIQLNFSNANPGVGTVFIDQVTLDGAPVDYRHENNMLYIPVTDNLTEGQLMEVFVDSRTGIAADRDDQGFNWDYEYGKRAIWTNSQPYNARDWWPSKDYPSDKADSMDIVVTIADNMVVASNGKLVSETDLGNGKKTWHWKVNYPIATYLVSLSIYEFHQWGDIYVDANNDILPIMFFTYNPPESPDPSYMTQNYRLVPEMIELYAELFGPYPFMEEKYGHAEWGETYGMEHQTLTSMGYPTERRVAHELAHMWYGDMITCNSYHEIWLNEGFARYAEALWWEHRYGRQGYKDKMKSFEYYGSGTIYVEDPLTQPIFVLDLSYDKGAWVLHMLRYLVGKETFFEIMQTYAEHPDHKHGTATTEEFKNVCEEVSGMELDAFFQQWIHGHYFPRYQVVWNQMGNDLTIDINQAGTIYDFPVMLRINTDMDVIDTTIRVDAQMVSLDLQLQEGDKYKSMIVDPDNWILNTTTITVGVDDQDYQGPIAFELEQNYPNPFNPSTTLEYTLDTDEHTRLVVYDMNGREVVELANQWMPVGHHHTVWDGLDVNGTPVDAGVYFCTLRSGVKRQMIKMLMLR
ncbi:MAG: T9SS type A sorting domain-containing protein [Candidatus Marinimicrobia bacterium]|nr:T9SS type A sorting domain-containing protein [Candidatus Neomarinimicrobiota bacterium]MCF7904610.1 T9SS type A sorting domain-containing protein [Candidatus Neomarinimicrobiota bacterium]